MNKENSNATWRLGQANHYEFGNEGVYPMPEEASGYESGASECQAEDQRLLRYYTVAGAAIFTTSFIVTLITIHMWDEDSIKLHVLDVLIKTLHAIARLLGMWALELEQEYNAVVNTLH